MAAGYEITDNGVDLATSASPIGGNTFGGTRALGTGASAGTLWQSVIIGVAVIVLGGLSLRFLSKKPKGK